MIRLTELERELRTVRARLEGSLTGDALRVLKAALAALEAEGIRQVVLEGDGIVHVDLIAVRDWPQVLPEGLTVRLTTGRRSLYQLLTSYGVEVEFVQEADGPL